MESVHKHIKTGRIINPFPFFLLLFINSFSTAQLSNLGTPEIQSYDRSEYNAGIHNWDIAMLDDRMYFANDNGLLEFDSRKWRLYPLPNQTILWSIDTDGMGRIYAGGQDELGYFEADASGALVFTSIKESIPEAYRKMEDIYDLFCKDGSLFVRTLDRVYIISEDSTTVIDDGITITTLAEVDGEMFLYQEGEGIFKIEQNVKKFYCGGEVTRSENVVEILPYNDQLLILTEKNGAFLSSGTNTIPWNIEANDYFRNNYLISGIALQNDMYAIGTKLSGIVLLDKEGKVFELLNPENDLASNNVVTLFADEPGNIWAGVSSGLVQVMNQSMYRNIYPDGDLRGAVYDMQIFRGKIYFGTNNGLYYKEWTNYYDPFNREDFHLVENTIGQVWALDTIGGKLIMGHHEGAFEVNGDRAVRISDDGGYWKFIRYGNYVLGGNYRGISVFENLNGQWQYRSALDGLEESCRIFMNSSDQEIWMSHPYRGVFRIIPSDDLSSAQVATYDTDAGFPSVFRNYVFSIGGMPYVAAEQGIYEYNEESDRFELNEELSSVQKEDIQVNWIKEDENTNLWFITREETGVIEIEDKGITREMRKVTFPELTGQFVSGFENLYVHDKQNIFALSSNKVLYFQQEQQRNPSGFRVLLSEVVLFSGQDSLLFGGHMPSQGDLRTSSEKPAFPVLENQQNDLLFEVSSNVYDHRIDIQYRFFLEGADEAWSQWSPESRKEFNNIAPGKYTFKAQARMETGEETEMISFPFEVLPPWFRTKVAYTIYGLFALLLMTGLVLVPRSRYRKKETALIQEKEKAEEEVLRLKNEKLAAEVEFKNSQLASSTMHIMQKTEVISKLKTELNQLEGQVRSPEARQELKKIMAVLSDDERLEESWEAFSHHFDQVHRNFLRRLRAAYPSLSPKDQKLCAYLRMNLNTKDIAPLMNISVRGVEVSRYRLRKKLDLDSDVNLNEFMMNF